MTQWHKAVILFSIGPTFDAANDNFNFTKICDGYV